MLEKCDAPLEVRASEGRAERKPDGDGALGGALTVGPAI